MDGVTNTRAFASRYGPGGLGVPLAGLYDLPAETILRRGLAAEETAPRPSSPMARPGFGFLGCWLDLEDELLRALSTPAVEDVIEAAGEAQSLRLLAGMPAQRGWTREAVLKRFLQSQSGRKARYAELFVDALGPRPGPRAAGRRARPGLNPGWTPATPATSIGGTTSVGDRGPRARHRIITNLGVPDSRRRRSFYTDYLGLSTEEFNLGWVARYTVTGHGSARPAGVRRRLRARGPGHLRPRG